MRWHILRTLLYKEYLRHLANRGGVVLVLLLVVASMLLSFFGQRDGSAGFSAGVQRCYIDYWESGPLVQHLRWNVPPELAEQVQFRHASRAPKDANGTLFYAQSTGAIQLRPLPPDAEEDGFFVWLWHP